MTKREAAKKLVILILVFVGISSAIGILQYKIGLENIRTLIIDAGIWGPVIYIFLHLLTHIFAPISGSPFYFVALAVFGKWAFIYTYIVVALSSFTNFWIARKLGRGVVVKLVGVNAMDKVDSLTEKKGVKALIVLRLFCGFITDFISYAAGLTSIKFSSYYVVSLIIPVIWATIGFFLFGLVSEKVVYAYALAGGTVTFIVPPIYYFVKDRIVKRTPRK